MNAQNSSNRLVQQLLSHIDKDWTTSCEHDGSSSAFVSQAAIRHFLKNFTQIRELIVAACGIHSVHSIDWIIDHCPIGLCILLRLEKGEYIGHFTEHAGLWDKNLPFFARPDDFPNVPLQPAFFEAFRQEQWRFYPITISQVRTVKFQKERPLPIVESELLKDGDTANLYRVRIHREYDSIYGPDQGIGHKDYALKTYIGKRAESYYRTEVENFAKLCLLHREPPEGLVRFHCGFEHNDTFNLLMDFATFGSLRDLFEDEEPPSSGQDIVRLWERFSMCIQALNRIHELDLSEDDPEGSRVFQGWHQDIRPENILIHRCGDDTMPHEFQFMLGDLGLSHFVRICRSKEDPAALDTGGTRTYGAPELYRHSDFDATRRLYATRAIDIWSLGCVMLDLCVWIIRGRRYLEAFGLRREEANEKLGTLAGDCFHDGQQPHPDLSTVVQDEMITLIDDVRKSDPITERVMDIIRRMLRPEPRERPTAPVVLADIEIAIQEAKERCNDWYARQRHRSRSNPRKIVAYEEHRLESSADAQVLQSPTMPSTAVTTHFPVLGTDFLPRLGQVPFPDSRLLNGTSGLGQSLNHDDNEDHRPDPHTHQSSPLIITPKPLTDSQDDTNTHERRPHSSSSPYPQDAKLLMPSNGLQAIQTGPAYIDQVEERRSFDPDRKRRSRRQNVPYLSQAEAIKWRAAKKRLFGQKPPLKFDYYRDWLKDRDHVFLIDDSRTMYPYKEHVTTLLKPLLYTVKEHDPDGVEVHFTISNSTQQSKKSSVLIHEVESHKFEGKTDISARLGQILRRYRVVLEDRRLAHRVVRPLSIYILTDGVWEGGRDAQTPVRELIAVLKQYRYDRKQVGIQFISFGNDEQGLQRLAELDQFGKQADVGLDIVDTESSLGNVLKMLLGAIDKTFDDEFSDGEAI